MRIVLALGLLVLLLAGCFNSTIQPGKGAYVLGYGNLPEVHKASVSQADIVVTLPVKPEHINDMRIRRRLNNKPEQIVLLISNWDSLVPWENQPTWRTLADTTWNLNVKMSWYAYQNEIRGVNWFLVDIFGNRLQGWVGSNNYLPNATTECPLGVYGPTEGLTYAEFYAKSLIEFIEENDYCFRCGNIDGIQFEGMYECPCSFSWDLELADPDLDGIAEGCVASCSTQDSPLSEMWGPSVINMVDTILNYFREVEISDKFPQESKIPSMWFASQSPGWYTMRHLKNRWDSVKFENVGKDLFNNSGNIRTNEFYDMLEMVEWVNEELWSPMTRNSGLDFKPSDACFYEIWYQNWWSDIRKQKTYDIVAGVAALTGGVTAAYDRKTGFHTEYLPWRTWNLGKPKGDMIMWRAPSGHDLYFRRFKNGRKIKYLCVNPHNEYVALIGGLKVPPASSQVINGDLSRVIGE